MEATMGVPKAQIITKNGKREFAIIPYADFLRIREELEDYEDLRCLREAKKSEKKAPTVGLSALKKSLARRPSRPNRRAKTR
jgi:hypothetical protein